MNTVLSFPDMLVHDRNIAVPLRVLARFWVAYLKKPGSRGNIRFTAPMKADSNDRWRPYRLEPSQLTSEVLRRLDSRQESAHARFSLNVG